MAYLSSKNRNSQNASDANNGVNYANRNTTNLNNKTMFVKNGSVSNNGYRSMNNYNTSKRSDNSFKEKMANVKEKQTTENAKQAIKEGISSSNPLLGMKAESELHGIKGQKLVDKYNSAATHEEGIYKVKRELTKKTRRKLLLLLLILLLPIIIVFIIAIIVVTIFKNADSQMFSNENNGTYQNENYQYDDIDVNIYANYPGLYEKVTKIVKEQSDKYQIEVDKYLVIATLIGPIENGLIVPVDDFSCGEPECYYFKGESKTWTQFLDAWGDQAELLSKMQMLTYINNQNEIKVDCGSEQTMEQYAKNDLETNTFPWWGWLNPINWFKGFRDAADAEVNARCVTANNGETKVPTVRVLSIEQGEYYQSVNAQNETEYVKDPNSGGVYFWNLLNMNGFIHEYLKDYLSDEYADDPEKNYEINKKVIIETANYIYTYYESIRKDCNGYQVIEGELDKIDFQEDGSSPIYTIDFEDMFVGGSVLATYGGARGEVAYAQAIITRSEAYNYIVEQHQKVIVGSAKMGCWWWKWNPTYDPSYENQEDNPNYDPDYPKEHFPEIYKAVTETRGIVVTNYGGTKVLETEYDAFCPTTRDPIGNFYYLPDGQRNLPIEVSKFSVPKSRTECPCFQNNSSQPGTQFTDTLAHLLSKHLGTPAQTTTEKCWDATGATKTDEEGNILYGYKYHTTGGHGRGVSQHGMAYFSQFGYDHEALIKLFMERDGAGVSFKRYDGSIEEGECDNHGYFNDGSETGNSCPTCTSAGDSNYNEVIGGTPFDEPLADALAKKGHTIDDLNQCIKSRVEKAGPGTRAGVVEAGVGLLECLIDMTGGYTLPYDHYGGAVGGSRNPDINGKLGVNSLWGQVGGTGCQGAYCRFGLNCATFVRWSMCNGGMDLCDKGSTFAQEMYHTTYFPEAIKIRLTPGFQVLAGNTSISSSEEAFNAIQPGDVLFSNRVTGNAGHVMLIVGKTDSGITIAENGRKTRNISKSQLIGSSDMTYGVLLLDDYYANSANRNSLY